MDDTKEVEVQQEKLSGEESVEVTPVKEVDKWVPPPLDYQAKKRFRDSRGVIYVKNTDGSLSRELPKEATPKKKAKVPYKTT